MADPDQMTREELLAAREKINTQIERLNYRGTYGTIGGDPRDRLKDELYAILEEVEAELSELDPKDA